MGTRYTNITEVSKTTIITNLPEHLKNNYEEPHKASFIL